MANTYTQLYIHYVFAVQNRLGLISKNWEDDLYKYISGIIANSGHKLYIVNGVQDHIHLLVSMSPSQSPSDFMYNVKRSSSLWINDNKLTVGKFSWQDGFGAFSIGKSQAITTVEYIKTQKEHHAKTLFQEEYEKLLEEYDVEYDERYIFKSMQ